MVPATLTLDHGIPAVLFTDGRRLTLPQSRQSMIDRYGKKSILCGIRPEYIRRSDAGELNITIDLLQPTGSRTYGTFQLSGVPVVAEFEAHDVTAAGQNLPVTIDANRLILIDPDTDQVL
jgi:multiple sugar transport system ATP-binding protein